MTKKCEIIDSITNAENIEDLFSFISIIPIKSLKEQLINGIKSIDDVNNIYFTCICINNWLPVDLLEYILSFLTFDNICKLSRVCNTFNVSCFNANVYYKTCESLLLQQDMGKTSISYDFKYKRLSIEIKSLNWDDALQRLCTKYWKQFRYLNIESPHHSINDIQEILSISDNDNKFEILHLKSRLRQFDFLVNVKQLQFINIPCMNVRIWNTLITNCKNLHGIMLICRSVINHHHKNRNNNDKFVNAPNLWFLSINSNHAYPVSSVISMLNSSPNLQHLSLNLSLNFQQEKENVFMAFPKTLVSLHLGEDIFSMSHETEKKINYGLNECENLCYIKLSIDFHIDANFQILFQLFTSCISNLKIIYINQFEAYHGEDFDNFIQKCALTFNKYYEIDTKIYVSLDMEQEEYQYINRWFKGIFKNNKISKYSSYFYDELDDEGNLFLSTISNQITHEFKDYKKYIQKLIDFKLFQDIMDV